MSSANLEMGVIFLTQTSIGLLGNSILLCVYNFVLFTGHKVRPTDLILNQLALANSTVLLSRGIPQTMAFFGWKHFLDDIGCKLLFYLHRVGRGVSISTTCFLSVFQAIKLCPSYSHRLVTPVKTSKYIIFCCFLFWILHLLLNIIIPLKVAQSVYSKNLSVQRKNWGYCSAHISDALINGLHAVMFSFFDIVSLGLTAWASGSMVLVLHRHKQRVQHIHSPSLSHRPSPEARATRTILILVILFILFYSFSSVCTFLSSFVHSDEWLVLTPILVTSCFPTVSSFVLISTDSRISHFCFSIWEKKTILSPNFLCI